VLEPLVERPETPVAHLWRVPLQDPAELGPDAAQLLARSLFGFQAPTGRIQAAKQAVEVLGELPGLDAECVCHG
jgi:hypothetical protein